MRLQTRAMSCFCLSILAKNSQKNQVFGDKYLCPFQEDRTLQALMCSISFIFLRLSFSECHRFTQECWIFWNRTPTNPPPPLQEILLGENLIKELDDCLMDMASPNKSSKLQNCAVLCLANLWDRNEKALWASVRANTIDTHIIGLLDHPHPEVSCLL